MVYLEHQLGARQVEGDQQEGRVSFRIFFPRGPDPHIATIRVAGDFQHLTPGLRDWDFENGFALQRDDSRPEGTFWSHVTRDSLPAGFYEYKYLIGFDDGSTRIVSDPCARYGGSAFQNAAVVVGGSRPGDNVVRRLQHGRRPLRDLIIYEMNIDDFTDEFRGARAPLDAVVDKLDDLRDLGFNAILFMPWTARKNREFDWGYEPFQYFAVEYRLANDLIQPAEKISRLKRLVTECHDRDIHVIMDGVFNHVSRDFPYKWMYLRPEECPYTGEFGGMFPGLQDLNFNNACLQEFVRDACLYWIGEFGIDGIRFDNTVNYNISGDPRGLRHLLQDIESYLKANGQEDFSLTLEHLTRDAPQIVDETPATSYWDNALYERCFDYLWRSRIDADFLNALNNSRYLKSDHKVATSYLSNHDHSHVAWQAGARDAVGAIRWSKTQPYVIALFCGSAVPMIQNGQEFGEDHWLPENDENTGRRVTPRPLRWKCANDDTGRRLRALYRRMAWIRNEHEALRHGRFEPDFWETWQTRLNPAGVGVDTDKQIAVFRRSTGNSIRPREDFVIVLNFSDDLQDVRVQFPEDGVWTDLLSDFSGSWQPLVRDKVLGFTVGSNWGHVFFKQTR